MGFPAEVFMARHNDVRLYGCVADNPIVISDDNGNVVSARVHLAVIKNQRNDNFNDPESILYDWPMINSYEPVMAQKIAKLNLYDVVELQGVLVTQKCVKITYCSFCGAKNETEGVSEYVYPLFLEKRNTESLTQKQAVQEIVKNQPISNNISIVGNLCNDPNYYISQEKKVETTTFQMGSERQMFLKFDDPEIRSDYPHIRAYGKEAAKAYLSLRTGSSILIEGYLHSRTFLRKSTCCEPSCKNEYQWEDTITEVIPYTIQNLANYINPKDADPAKIKYIEEARGGNV